jgi:hypothetical protein
MAAQPFTALEAQMNALDHDTALRVALLVLECQASLELALIAVQEADRTAPSCADDQRRHSCRRLAPALDAWRSAMHEANGALFQ